MSMNTIKKQREQGQQGKPMFEFVSVTFATALDAFCERINRSNADVYIALAQKAVCLMDVLKKYHLLDERVCNKYISSDSLDFENVIENYKDKTVLLIDDIMITGYSIARIANKLIDAGLPEDNLQIVALARNREYQVMSFFDEKNSNMFYCALTLDDAECIKLSSEICKILTYYGMPHSVDFPVFQIRKLYDFLINSFMNPCLWSTYEITMCQDIGGVDRWTMFPKDTIKESVWSYLGCNLESIFHLKVRLYVHKYPDTSYDITILPMALLHEINVVELDKLAERILPKELWDACKTWKFKSKVRLIQYYVAYALYKAVEKTIKPLNCDIPGIREISMLFGNEYAAMINKAFDEFNIDRSIETFNLDKKSVPNLLGYSNNLNLSNIYKKQDDSCREINIVLTDAFVWWNNYKEISSRLKLKENPKHYRRDFKDIEEIREHLHCGFSMKALTQLISNDFNLFNNEEMVSVYIDRATDEGYIVPIIYENGSESSICQAYRHGEDLPFSVADKLRIAYFLLKFDNAVTENMKAKQAYSDVVLNKIVVLFYQLGLDMGGIFNRFLGFKNDIFLKERFCVHGAVETIRNSKNINEKIPPYVSQERKIPEDSTYTSFLVDTLHLDNFLDYKDVVQKSRKNRNEEKTVYEHLVNSTIIEESLKNEQTSLEADITEQIDKIAKMISAWYVRAVANYKTKVKSDLIALTSCADIYKFISSIATEVYYFKRYWEVDAYSKVNKIADGGFCASAEFSKEAIANALYSGIDKHKMYNDDRAQRVINRVKQILHKNLQELENDWTSCWRYRAYGSNLDTVNYSECILQYLYFYAACYEWLRNGGLNRIIAIEDLKPYIEYKQNLKETRSFAMFDNLIYISKLEKSSERASEFIKLISSALDNATILLENIREWLEARAVSYTVRYSSALIVDVLYSDEKTTEKMLKTVWNNLEENKIKTHLNIVILKKRKSYVRFGVFYECSGRDAFKVLFDFSRRFYEEVLKNAYPTKMIIVPSMPNQIQFKHNLRENITKNTHIFNRNLADAICTKMQNSEYNHSLKLLLTRLFTPKDTEAYKSMLKNSEYLLPDLEVKELEIASLSDVSGYIERGVGLTLNLTDSPIVKVIRDNKIIGTGTMFRIDGEVYCVTCQHLLDGCSSNEISIELYTGNRVPCCLLNYYKDGANREGKDLREERYRDASKDILVMKPQMQKDPSCNGHCFFTEQQCLIPKKGEGIQSVLGDSYVVECNGYPNQSEFIQNLKINHLLSNMNGYITAGSSQDSKNGFSGAGVVVRRNSKDILVGMFKAHKENDKILIISAKTICTVLDNIKKERRRNKNE